MTDASPIEEIRRAADAVRGASDLEPRVGIVTGTGLSGVADEFEDPAAVPYEEIPGVPPVDLEGHAGRLVLGRLEGHPVAVLQGRHHAYEGYSLREVAFPVRVLRELGAEVFVTTGICGGMQPLWEVGDFVLLADHINLMGDNPLVGPNVDEQGPRFPDMSGAYDAGLREAAREAALELGIPTREGVYVAVTGPSVETAAEYRMLRRMGADVVGMSTVPEVIVANHAGMRVLGVSVITDLGLPDALEPVDVEAIMATAAEAGPKLVRLLRGVLARLE